MNCSLSLTALFLLAVGTSGSVQKTSQIEEPELVQILAKAEENTNGNIPNAVLYRKPKRKSLVFVVLS